MMKSYAIKLEKQQFSLVSNEWTCLTGPVGSGKSKFLHNLTKKGNVKKFFPQEKVVYLSDRTSFPQEKVIKTLLMNVEDQKIIEKILKLFNISSLSTLFHFEPSIGMCQVLLFLYYYIQHPTVFVLDHAFSMIDPYHKEKLLTWFKKECKKNHQTVLFTSLEAEDLLYADQIILYAEEQIKFIGTRKEFYQEEKLVSQYGLEYPFDVELYHKLKYYNVFKRPIYNRERMIEHLWESKNQK